MNKLQEILQLDKQQAQEVLDYARSLPRDQGVIHLMSFLGADNIDLCHQLLQQSTYQPVQQSQPVQKSTPKQLQNSVQICDCMATEHDLIRNCLSCGKIICKQEGAGPCLFCGDGQKLFKQRKKKSAAVQQTYKSLVNTGGQIQQKGQVQKVDQQEFPDITVKPKELNAQELAIKKKDQLLAYDRTDTVRTMIHDQSEDIKSVQGDIWMTSEQRAQAQRIQQQYELEVENQKKGIVMSIDLKTKQVKVQKTKEPPKPDFSKLHQEARSIAMPSSDVVQPRYIDQGRLKVVKGHLPVLGDVSSYFEEE